MTEDELFGLAVYAGAGLMALMVYVWRAHRPVRSGRRWPEPR